MYVPADSSETRACTKCLDVGTLLVPKHLCVVERTSKGIEYCLKEKSLLGGGANGDRSW
jgi:hypothetical protein